MGRLGQKGRSDQVSVLGKRGDRVQSENEVANFEEKEGDTDQCKKKRGAGNGEKQEDSGKEGGKEATEHGALGQLVGAAESARQEP